MLLTQGRRIVWDRPVLAILCLAAGAGLANWIDTYYGAFDEPYGNGLEKWQILGLVACFLFATGAVASLISGRYGVLLALTASVVCWTSFAPTLLRHRVGDALWEYDHGAMPTAIVLVVPATCYAAIRVRRQLISPAKRQPARPGTGERSEEPNNRHPG